MKKNSNQMLQQKQGKKEKRSFKYKRYNPLVKLLSIASLAVVLTLPSLVKAQTVNLSNYVRVGRYNLPEPVLTVPPDTFSLLCQEASAVTYNWDSNTLFVLGDGGTSIVQVSKTGTLINSMTLAPGNSPQGTEFYDPEGLAYIGSGMFVMTEERDRNAVKFTYAAGTTLIRANAQTVKLGTTIGNIGLEGVTYDPMTSGFIFVKEKQPESIFQTGIDFNAGTATNGSPTTVNSIDLFNPALANTLDFADVFALSNLPNLIGQPNYGNLLVLSQESGEIVNIDRSGNISSTLTIVTDPGNPLSVVDQQHEGITMDRDSIIYTVSENGGGDFDHPQLWVYAPSTVANLAPTAIVLNNVVDSILENTSTASPVKVADIAVTD
ncbi:MAG: SdiA-regulated domain-containing protein, partial [Bacteroidota bacterium]